MDDNLQKQHAHIGKAVPDPVHIVLYAAHKLPGACAVKKFRAQGLDMVEQVPPYVQGNLGTCQIKNKFFTVLEDASSCAHAQYPD
ncbi:hypothetical protein IMSAGC019_03210 [Lachnospiraceae bacterium]|nr:hypothetical protein IMSAGC019_03210 [Lachnospiraceae bacterium]